MLPPRFTARCPACSNRQRRIDDLAAAALGLDAVVARRVAVPEGAADDLAPVAAHHVDARAAARPSARRCSPRPGSRPRRRA